MFQCVPELTLPCPSGLVHVFGGLLFAESRHGLLHLLFPFSLFCFVLCFFFFFFLFFLLKEVQSDGWADGQRGKERIENSSSSPLDS